MNKFYVYQLRRSDATEPFYIGKGHGTRAKRHFTPSYLKDKSHKSNTIIKAQREGIDVVVDYIHKNLLEEDALRIEVWTIKMWGRADLKEGPLTNATDGGDGVTGPRPTYWTEERREIQKQAMKKAWDAGKYEGTGAGGWNGREVTEDHRRKSITKSPPVTCPHCGLTTNRGAMAIHTRSKHPQQVIGCI